MQEEEVMSGKYNTTSTLFDPNALFEPNAIVDPIVIDLEKMQLEKSNISEAPQLSPWRQILLLLIFIFAQFLDTYYNGALFSAIPTMIPLLDMTGGESIWLISSYQMLMAAFLLIVSVFQYKSKNI